MGDNSKAFLERKRHCIEWGITFVVVIAAIGGWEAHSGQGGVEQTIRSAVQPLASGGRQPAGVQLTGAVVPVDTPYAEKVFWTETRTDKISRFKCSQCHNDETVTETNAAATAHGTIQLVHGSGEKQLSCYTCHNRRERDFLNAETVEKLEMNHSYALCGQCHFRQKKDWAGGAHGKRVANWAGDRVVKNCTACHNPHAPRFEKRWPVTYSPENQR